MNLKYAIIACALTLGFASCSSDDAVDNGNIIPNGEAAVALIKLSQSTPQTRANLEEPTTEEAAVKKAIVFIFDASAKLETSVELTSTEASTGKAVETTTGSHYFYAAVNPVTPITIAEGTSIEDAKKTILASLAEGTLTSTTNGFFMTNIDDALAQNIVKSSDVTGADNPIVINVGRAVAKVNVSLADDVINGNEVAGGKFTDMEYKIGGNPNQMYLFPVYEGGVLKTPLYAADYLAANYFEEAAYKATPTYAIENSNASAIKQGEATYARVKGVFTPDGMNEGDDFYRVFDPATEAWETTIYATEAAAKTAASTTKKVVKYTAGVCYYAFWIADETAAEKYSIKRNNYYNVEIQHVAKIGTNNEGGDKDIDDNPIEPSNPPIDPEEPIENDTYLRVSINVLDWTVVNAGVGL